MEEDSSNFFSLQFLSLSQPEISLSIRLSSPFLLELPPPGRYRLVSNEEELSIDTYAKAARKDYRNNFEQRTAELEAFCQRYGVHLMPLSTEDDPVTTLQTALGRRIH